MKRQIEECYTSRIGPGEKPVLRQGERRIRGLVVPHAGYMYSGPVAAHAYYALARDGFPEVFVILGPNHTGMGSSVAVTTEDFQTPLGVAQVDKELVQRIVKGVVSDDITAHRGEHSIEVQLPFLQYIKEEISFVPICMALQDFRTATEVGKTIREATSGMDVTVIASTDFSHYVPARIATQKDGLIIDEIVGLNPKRMYEKVVRENVSMCGYGPVVAMLTAVQGKEGKLLKYATSGDVSPMREVVGYGAIAVSI